MRTIIFLTTLLMSSAIFAHFNGRMHPHPHRDHHRRPRLPFPRPNPGVPLEAPILLSKEKAPKTSTKMVRVYPEYRRVGTVIIEGDANDVRVKDFVIYYEGGGQEQVRHFIGNLDEGQSKAFNTNGRTISEIVFSMRSRNHIGRHGKVALFVRYYKYGH